MAKIKEQNHTKYFFKYIYIISVIFVILYLIFGILTSFYATEINKDIVYSLDSNSTIIRFQIFKFNTWQIILSSVFAIALGIISMHLSGILTSFYEKIKNFGILDVRVNRKGQDPNLTSMWIDRIYNSKELIIVGTTSRGWFIYAKNELKNVINDNPKMQVKIFILNPFGLVWKSKLDGYIYGYNITDYIEQYIGVLKSLISLKKYFNDRLQIWFYDVEPISCVITDNNIYYSLYLPLESRLEVPELKLDRASDLGQKIYTEVTEHLIDTKRKSYEINLKNLEFNYKIMKYLDNLDNTSKQREMIFSQIITCDFCKERFNIPTRYHELYDNTLNFKERIIKKYDNFYLIPSLGQLVNNYLLIVSNQHITGSSQLSMCCLEELVKIKESIKKINKNNNCDTLFFEHGMPQEGIQCFAGCGISHLHIHSVPLSETIEKDFFNELEKFLNEKSSDVKRYSISEWTNITKYKSFSYILVEFNNEVYVYLFNHNELVGDTNNIEKIPSQLMRLFIKEYLNIEDRDYNWRLYNDEYENLISTMSYYKDKLK